MSDFEESLSAEIATVNRKIDKVELEISSVETAITEAREHVLSNDNKEFWESELQQLREDKKQLREDKKQLRDLVLLKERQHQQSGQGGGGVQGRGIYLLRGVIKYARSRSGCRYKVYLAAETCHAKVRVGVGGDGIVYSGVADLGFQLVFRQESDAENFESAIIDIPRVYRKRPLLSSLEIEEDEKEEADVPDMTLHLENIVLVNSSEELERVLRNHYVTDVEVDGGNASPPFDPLAGTATSYASSCVDIGEETLLRLIDNPDSVNLFRQNPEKCHLMSQKKYPRYAKNPNNIVFMSRLMHQHFDVIDSTEHIATFFLEYVDHSQDPMDGTVQNNPCKVYETTVRVVFKDEEAKQVLAGGIREYTNINETTIQIRLFFPNPLKFGEFSQFKADAIKKQWRQYDGEL
jgi:hypothetical protein